MQKSHVPLTWESNSAASATTFSGSVALPDHSAAPICATMGCSCKACLQRRTANPHIPVACNNFWSDFFLTFYSGWFCRSLQLLWGYKVEGLGAHGFPVSITLGSLKLCGVTWALFCAQSMFVRLVLNNKADKSTFLSQLLLQMRLKSHVCWEEESCAVSSVAVDYREI